MKRIGLIFLEVLLMVFIASCGGTKKLSNQNVASMYSPDLNFTFPKFRTYNFDADSVKLFFKLKIADFLSVNDGSDDHFNINASVLLVLYPSYETKVILDSTYAQAVVQVSADSGSGAMNVYELMDHPGIQDGLISAAGFLEGSISFKAPVGSNYVAQVFVYDLNKRSSLTRYIPVIRNGIQPPGDFLPVKASDGNVIIENYFQQPDSFKIVSAMHPGIQVFYRYFDRNYPIAAPPFSSLNPAVLSYFSTYSRSEAHIDEPVYHTTSHGIYHIQADSLIKEGFTMLQFEADFPRLTDVSDLLESIRYLTTRKEYEHLVSSKNKKEAIDDFWVNIAGNYERARVLIRGYYSRVQLANELFTSYLEGWKSDRGLIYVIFGPPATVYKDNVSESWNYSSSSSLGPMIFTFDKIQNPFTENDYSLRRLPGYENPWYRAVDGWREGRIVDGNN
ncbi:MAG TPA: GWxTD domain-containing protein [Bacteroidia bacterium]|nr:GWxTD domain-containing protein [Bacteroidia bacterium]